MLHSISGEYPYMSIYKADVLFYTQRHLLSFASREFLSVVCVRPDSRR